MELIKTYLDNKIRDFFVKIVPLFPANMKNIYVYFTLLIRVDFLYVCLKFVDLSFFHCRRIFIIFLHDFLCDANP